MKRNALFATNLFFCCFVVQCLRDSRYTTQHVEVSRHGGFPSHCIYMCAEPRFQAQISVDTKTRKLIFVTTLLVVACAIQSMSVASTFSNGGFLLALNIVYPVCCGIDVHKSFIVACIASTDSVGVTVLQIPSLFHVPQRFAIACCLAVEQ